MVTTIREGIEISSSLGNEGEVSSNKEEQSRFGLYLEGE